MRDDRRAEWSGAPEPPLVGCGRPLSRRDVRPALESSGRNRLLESEIHSRCQEAPGARHRDPRGRAGLSRTAVRRGTPGAATREDEPLVDVLVGPPGRSGCRRGRRPARGAPPGARSGAGCPNLLQRPGSSRDAREKTLIFRTFFRGRSQPGAPLQQIWTRPVPDHPRSPTRTTGASLSVVAIPAGPRRRGARRPVKGGGHRGSPSSSTKIAQSPVCPVHADPGSPCRPRSRSRRRLPPPAPGRVAGPGRRRGRRRDRRGALRAHAGAHQQAQRQAPQDGGHHRRRGGTGHPQASHRLVLPLSAPPAQAGGQGPDAP